MENEKLLKQLIKAVFIMAGSVLILAVVVLAKSFIPTQPAGQGEQGRQQPKIKISKHYAKHSMTLDKALKKNQPIAVLFYVDWCGFCQRFAPLFADLSKSNDLKDYSFVFVNCEDPNNSEYVREYGVNGYPTLYLVNPVTKDKAHVANRIMFGPDAMEVLTKQFTDFVKSGSKAVTQPKQK